MDMIAAHEYKILPIPFPIFPTNQFTNIRIKLHVALKISNQISDQ